MEQCGMERKEGRGLKRGGGGKTTPVFAINNQCHCFCL